MPTHSTPLVVALKDLSFRYPGAEKYLFSNLNLAVHHGARIGIIGGNGCGKSTLSKLLLSIHLPTQGEILIFDQPAAWSRHLPGLGYVGDPGHNAQELGLPTGMTIQEVLSTVEKLYNLENTETSYQELIVGLGLEGLLERKIANLSTGERKRLMICLTFIRKPKFIIFDEPFDGLDKEVVVYVKHLMQQVMRDETMTFIFISHSRVEIDTYTDQVYALESGDLIPIPQQSYIGEIQVSDMDVPLNGKAGKVIGDIMETLLNQHDVKEVTINLKAKN